MDGHEAWTAHSRRMFVRSQGFQDTCEAIVEICLGRKVDMLKLLYDKLNELHTLWANTPHEHQFPRPLFKLGSGTGQDGLPFAPIVVALVWNTEKWPFASQKAHNWQVLGRCATVTVGAGKLRLHMEDTEDGLGNEDVSG
eukprot:scaffold126693_cov22-Tisochrysis_lutea.AAC.4